LGIYSVTTKRIEIEATSSISVFEVCQELGKKAVNLSNPNLSEFLTITNYNFRVKKDNFTSYSSP